MKRCRPNFKETEGTRIAALSNAALLDETLSLAGGDDYDGCFTKEGAVSYELLEAELRRRLEEWLKS